MAADKMFSLLAFIVGSQGNLKSLNIYGNSNGELVFEFNGQPSKIIHNALLDKRFVFVDNSYIYRP